MKPELFDKIISDASVEAMTVSQLREQLDAEMKKNVPDYDLIDEITCAILEAEDIAADNTDISEAISQIRRKNSIKKKKISWIGIAAAACIVFALNNYSLLKANGFNFFEALISSGDGILIDLNKVHSDNPATDNMDIYEFTPEISENDPYGMKYLCSLYGFDVPVPYELPENMKYLNMTYNNYTSSDSLTITYKDTVSDTPDRLRKQITITWTLCDSEEDKNSVLDYKYPDLSGYNVMLHESDNYILSHKIPVLNIYYYELLYVDELTCLSMSFNNVQEYEVTDAYNSIR